MKMFEFIVTFTRRDENDANTYRVAFYVVATSREVAETELRESIPHLTIIDVELFATMNEAGDVVLS